MAKHKTATQKVMDRMYRVRKEVIGDCEYVLELNIGRLRKPDWALVGRFVERGMANLVRDNLVNVDAAGFEKTMNQMTGFDPKRN